MDTVLSGLGYHAAILTGFPTLTFAADKNYDMPFLIFRTNIPVKARVCCPSAPDKFLCANWSLRRRLVFESLKNYCNKPYLFF